MRVILIGAGLVGMTSAYYLNEAGVAVTVIDRQSGPGLGASFANGALLHPSLVDPWNAPGVFGRLLRNLGREDSAILLRMRSLPSLIGWGLEFLRQSSPARFEVNTLKNLRLARYSLERTAEIRNSARIEYGAYRRGTLMLFRDPRVQQKTRSWYDRLARHGLAFDTLDPAAAIVREPALAPIRETLSGALAFHDDEGGDPFRFCTGLRDYLAARKVDFRFDVRVSRLDARNGQLFGVVTNYGETLKADRFVLSSGSDSPLLGATAGLRLPIRPAKGYTITVPGRNDATAPLVPVTDTSLHMAVIPLADGRIRVAGTAEFAGYDLSIKPARVANLVRLLRQLYPKFAESLDPHQLEPWCGLRPMSADGVPLIGPTRIGNLYLNTGHGHLGWTMAAGSGRLLTDLVLGRNPSLNAADYSPERFH